jgi:hypothetical protein
MEKAYSMAKYDDGFLRALLIGYKSEKALSHPHQSSKYNPSTGPKIIKISV